MKRAVKQILFSVIALLVFCLLCRFFFFNEYELRVPLNRSDLSAFSAEDIQFAPEQPGILRAEEARIEGDLLRLKIQPLRRGDTHLDIKGPSGSFIALRDLHVGPFNTVYDKSSGSFTGDSAVLAATALFFLAVSAIMIWNFRMAKGSSFYAYTTIYFAGFSIFSTVTGIVLSFITVQHLIDPLSYPMYYAYRVLCGASLQFMLITLPVVAVFSFALAISNIVLLRHERTVLRNLLGIALSLLLLAGGGLGLFLITKDISGSETAIRRIETLRNIYATVFVYFECMLAGSVICALKATRMQPEYDQDYILVLGCRFRNDGTLTPLLQGRVDRALAFWYRQRKLFGKEAILIPSGGQGPDECMSEAAAMRRYMLEKGLDASLIQMEDRSASTLENMVFSKKIIDGNDPAAHVVYATTNYHLFRSGLLARRAGLNAVGIGSKTCWWFWPNAFVRECVGMVANRWKEGLTLLLALIAFFALMAMILP